MNDKINIDIIANMRRTYVLANAKSIIDELQQGRDVRWLTQKLSEFLEQYESGLEKLCAHYQKLAMDALQLQANPIIFPAGSVPKSTQNGAGEGNRTPDQQLGKG